jgi:NAD(P)-dependent dehydrogenase (short-subunit alcohol dehydrogenase family)
MELSGRRALVAGGAGHIGRACVDTLRELGADVVVADLAQPEEAADGIVVDLADEQAARAAVREATERLGGLDVLVHCAALVGQDDLDGWSVPFPEQTVSAWNAALTVNLTSAFVLVQEAHEELRRSGSASVVVVGSIYGVVGPDFTL